MTTHERAQQLIGDAKIHCERTVSLVATSRALIERAKRLLQNAAADAC